MRNGPYELIVPPPEYPGKRYRGRYAYEHRVNWWKKTGKNPDDFPKHVVHHGDEAKRNNEHNNIDLMGRGDHTRHHTTPAKKVISVCKNCGKEFERLARKKQIFCSRQCIGYYYGPMCRKNYCRVAER